MRSCRRLLRYWMLLGTTYLICGVLYFEYFSVVSSWPLSPSDWTPGSIDTRYMINGLFESFGLLSVIGIVILCFDCHYRDVRARVHEVISSKPPNNLELVIGRILGDALLILLPLLLFLLIVSCYEIVLQYFNISNRFGMVSLPTIPRLLWSIVPCVLLFSTLITCFASIVRMRLVVLIVAIVLLFVLKLLYYQFPLGLRSVFSLFPGILQFHSDLAPTYHTFPVQINRLSLLLISLAFIAFATSFLKRVQPGRILFAASGCVGFVVGVLSIVGLYISFFNTETRKDEWANVLNRQPTENYPDIQHIQGNVVLFPGRAISLDLTLTVILPKERSSDSVLYFLNPGYRIQKLFVDGKEISNHDFSHGLLKVPISVFPVAKHQLRIVARGKPNEHFAYLDQARDYQKQLLPWVNELGTKNYIFHSNYVALVPAMQWYPTSRSVLNEDLLGSQPRDLFTMDVVVSVPTEWTVAMVGEREAVIASNRAEFRFKTEVPVPEMALMASNFETRSTTIKGIKFELLLSRKHTRNLNALDPYFNIVKDWIATRLSNAEELSLEYPYKCFYIVEVPSTLRIFGGGWRMDTTLYPPGMMLMRETTFPTVRFDLAVQTSQIRAANSAQIFLDKLVSYFEDDLLGGNPFSGVSRNFVNHQSSPSGRGGTVLDYLVEKLATKLIFDRHSLFLPSAWEYGMISPDLFAVYSDVATQGRNVIAALPSTWEVLDSHSLLDLDFTSKPIQSFRALSAKTDLVVQVMTEHFGSEKVARILRHLTQDFRGRSYTLENFYTAAKMSGIDVNEWLVDWLESSTLPGYIVANTNITKVSVSGRPMYQTTFVLHNAEPASGFVATVVV